MTRTQGFTQGIGRWLGTAEVYDGHGRFVGNATDQRHVQKEEGKNSVRIDLSFVGPMKFAGHYTIEDHTDYRLYQGPANIGFAETLANNLIDANAYWPVTGLSQRFFLMILPGGNRQISLALMSRGEKLIYVVVGEYNRVEEGGPKVPDMINGTSYDLHDDPTAGRNEILLERPGRWEGSLKTLDADLYPLEDHVYSETTSQTDHGLLVKICGTQNVTEPRTMMLKSNGWESWSSPGDMVGSYSLSGGRALSGQFHFLQEEQRVWRREVASHDGSYKAVVHTIYRGGKRIGVQFGVLQFSGEEQ